MRSDTPSGGYAPKRSFSPPPRTNVGTLSSSKVSHLQQRSSSVTPLRGPRVSARSNTPSVAMKRSTSTTSINSNPPSRGTTPKRERPNAGALGPKRVGPPPSTTKTRSAAKITPPSMERVGSKTLGISKDAGSDKKTPSAVVPKTRTSVPKAAIPTEEGTAQGLNNFLSTISQCENFLRTSSSAETCPFPFVSRLLQENTDLRSRMKEVESELADARTAQSLLEENKLQLEIALHKRDEDWEALNHRFNTLKEEFKQVKEDTKIASETAFKHHENSACPTEAPIEVMAQDAAEAAHAKHLACLMESVVEFANKQTSLLSVAVDAINVL